MTEHEFLLICAPHTNKLFPVLVSVALGPITVIFENTAAVCGLKHFRLHRYHFQKLHFLKYLQQMNPSVKYQTVLFPETIIGIKIIIQCSERNQVCTIYCSTKPFKRIIICIRNLYIVNNST